MQVTKGTWCMCIQCVPGSLFLPPTPEPGNEATILAVPSVVSQMASGKIFVYPLKIGKLFVGL